MKQPLDPPRLIDQLDGDSEELRAALEAGRAELPGRSQLADLRERMGPLLLPPGGGAGPDGGGAPGGLVPKAGAAAATAAGAVSAAKVAAVAIAISVGGAGVWWSSTSARPVAAPQVQETSSPRATDPDVAPGASANEVPSAVDAPKEASPSPTDEPPHASTGLPAPVRSAKPATSAHPAEPSAGEATAASELPRETEIAMLQRAQAALASNPAGALAIAGEHARTFAAPTLGQEREIIAITALVRLGRTGEARGRAARFSERYPVSAHRRRIEVLLGAPVDEQDQKPRPPGP